MFYLRLKKRIAAIIISKIMTMAAMTIMDVSMVEAVEVAVTPIAVSADEA